jgi:hypothetical protein
MSGAIPPFPKCAFMVWCSVKKNHRDSFTFTLPLSINYTKLLTEEVYGVYTVSCRFTCKLFQLSASLFLGVDEINFCGFSLVCLILSEYFCKVCWYHIHLCNFPSFTMV